MNWTIVVSVNVTEMDVLSTWVFYYTLREEEKPQHEQSFTLTVNNLSSNLNIDSWFLVNVTRILVLGFNIINITVGFSPLLIREVLHNGWNLATDDVRVGKPFKMFANLFCSSSTNRIQLSIGTKGFCTWNNLSVPDNKHSNDALFLRSFFFFNCHPNSILT